ncbi:MAG: hypothetical protein KGM47_07340 [Acidobacteriota bacterium]|nr:hypothetical protein [Acidobacteriota bacterium]
MRKPIRLAALLFAAMVVAVCAPSSWAQQAAGVVPVHMVVTVQPLPGKRPAVVNRQDVMVYQGKERLNVTGWQHASGDHAGLDLFILIDDTASTSLGSQLGDLRDFINAQPSTTAIGVGYMANTTVRIAQNFTTDHAAAAKALRLPLGTISAMDSPYLSLIDLMKRWPKRNNRREVLMITDGIDRFRLRGMRGLPSISPDAQSASDRAQRDGIIVHSLYTQGTGFASRNFWLANMGENNASMVADVSGGASFFLGYLNPPSFKPWLDQLSRILENQYLLTFLVKPEKKAGLVYIRLETEVPGAELVAAKNVYVPAAKE